MREFRPTYITSALGGVITAIGGLRADKIEIKLFSVIIFCSSFFVPIFYLVVDMDALKGRFKRNGIKAFVFPCNKEEVEIVLRIFIWFLCAGMTITLFDRLF